jgi:DNA-binding winged helix-turn-helix (wHTH) protein
LLPNVKYFAPFRLDLTGRTLWRDAVRVPLTHKAFDLLAVLVERAGHVVAKATLLEAVWPQTHVHPDNVKVLIGEIRRALGDDPMRPRFIRSLIKRGYIFIAPVVDAPLDPSASSSFPIFVGREPEMDRLLGALDQAAGSHRQVAFITGDAGIGKTALCEAFLRVAATRHAMRATWAQCMRLSGPSEPYYPLLDLLTRLARSTDDEIVATTLARHAPSWLPHLPALSEDPPGAFAAGTHVATAARMLREVVTALETLAEDTPLVLWIEDLQWADPATIDVLASLGQRRDPAKLLILATIRSSDSGAGSAPLRRAQVDLLARPHTSELRLQPLAQEDVARYLDLQLGDEVSRQSSSLLYRLTSGNPLFLVTAIEHLVRKGYFVDRGEGWRLEVSPDALEAAIPASLVGTVARELEELAPDERQAIDAASVGGVEFSLWLAAHAANMDELALEPVLEVLARRRRFIVREGVVELANGVFSPLYRFTHGLYQEIVIDHMPSTARAAAHGRAGLAMERVFTGREHEAAADLACHFHGAGDHLRAARYLRVAAGNALRRYAPREAGALLHGAVTHAAHLEPDERARVEIPLMLELGQAQLAAGETDLAIQTLSRLERRAGEERRHDDRLRALLTLAEAHVGISRAAALDCARQIKVVSPLAADATLASTADIRAGLIELHFDGWSDEIADRCLEGLRDFPRQISDEHRTLAIRLLFLHTSRSAYAVAWRTGRKLLPLALASGNVADCAYCYYLLGVAALHLGRWDDALAVATEGAAVSERTGSTRYAVTLRLLQAWIALESQRFDEAYRLSVGDRALTESGGWANARQMSLLFGGAAALAQGRLADAAADLESLRNWYARERILMDWFWEPQLHTYLAELSLQRGDLERATIEAAAAQQTALATPERTWRGRAHVTAALVALERRAFDEAAQYLRQARREIRGIHAPLVAWRIEAVTATLLEKTAQPDSARRARQKYERALERLQHAADPARTGSLQNQRPPPGRIH